jgi:hypothetical protein
VEKCSKDVKFDFQEHLLGGVGLCFDLNDVSYCLNPEAQHSLPIFHWMSAVSL